MRKSIFGKIRLLTLLAAFLESTLLKTFRFRLASASQEASHLIASVPIFRQADSTTAAAANFRTTHLKRTLESLQALYAAKGDTSQAAEWKHKLEEFQKAQAAAKPSQAQE